MSAQFGTQVTRVPLDVEQPPQLTLVVCELTWKPAGQELPHTAKDPPDGI